MQLPTHLKPVILEAPEKVRHAALARCCLSCPSDASLLSRAQEQYTIPLPDGIAAFDLDVIKLTAQFVARNGKSFLTGLTSREHMNPQARAPCPVCAAPARVLKSACPALPSVVCSSTS